MRMVSIPTRQPLTEKQEKILAFVRDCVRDTGMPPTREEIAREFGFAVRASAEEHLRAIARKGYVELIPGSSRGIRLKDAAQALPVGFFLPLVALGGLFGMNVDLPDFVDGWFWIIFCGGLLLGGSLVWLVGRKTGSKS